MGKRTFITLWLLASAFSLPALDNPGIVMLDNLVAQFQRMKQQGSGGYAAVDKSIQDLMAAAKSASAQKQIDPPFFRRFTRLLQIMKLAIVSGEYDREGVLNSLIQKEINGFVADVSGVEPEGRDAGIAQLADAISNEIVDLRLTQECRGQREELWRRFNRPGSETK